MLWQPKNQDLATQLLGQVVRVGTAPDNVLLAIADSKSHTASIVGVRQSDVAPSAAGLVIPFNTGVLIRLVSEPILEDSIYLSDTSAGNGTNVAPAIAIFLGIVYEKIQIAGVWYGYLLPEENVIESPGDQVTLARAYASGNVVADQTLGLLDADGGGIVVDGTAAGFTQATAFQVKGANAGVVAFPRVGGLSVASTISLATPAAAWSAVNFQSSTLTLTGGPAVSAALAMVRVGQATINGVGNTVTDAYSVRVDFSPVGTATITRAWSLGAMGAVQMQLGLVLGSNLSPPAENDLVMGVGGTIVSEANSGRIGYLAGGTQKFVVSQNGGAYVPLLTSVTLASTYAFGSIAADQTMTLLNAKGGGIIIDGTTPTTFTGASILTLKSANTAVVGAQTILNITGTFFPSLGSGSASYTALNAFYTISQGVATGTITGLLLNAIETNVHGTHNFIDCQISSQRRFTVGRLGGLTIAQSAADGIVPTVLSITAAAHTNITASTVDPDVLFNLSATKQWATGNIATQIDFSILARTYAFVGASTVTTAATLAISGAPIPGANAIITNPSALLVQSGATILNGVVAIGGFSTTPAAPAQFSLNLVPAPALQPQAGPAPIYIQGQGTTAGLLAGIDVDHSFWMQACETVTTFTAYPIFLNPSGSGVGIGLSGSSMGNASLRIQSTVTSASTAWSAFVIQASTFAYAGAGTTTATFRMTQFSGGTVSSTNAWTITDAYVVQFGTFTFNANVTNTRQWCLYLQGNLKVDGGQRWNAKNVATASPYTVLGPGTAAADHVLQINTAGAFTVNLPAISSVTGGWNLVVVDSRYNAAAANITITPNGADKINNVAGSFVLNVNGQSVMLVANATSNNWEIIATFP